MLRGQHQEVSAAAPTLVLLAAGLGSRFGGEKQFTALGPHGETLMDYALFDAVRAGIGRTVLIVRPDAVDRIPVLQRRYEASMEVLAVAQDLADLPAGIRAPVGRTRPWGSAHALLCARRALSEGAFIVANADDFYGAQPYQSLVSAPGAEGTPAALWHLAGFRLGSTISTSGPVNRAICRVDASGLLLGLEEVRGIRADTQGALLAETSPARSLSADAVVSMNLWGFTSGIFDVLERTFDAFLARADLSSDECYLPEAVDAAIGEGIAVRVLPTASQWCGVTFKEDAPRVRAHLAALAERGDYPSPLWP